MPQISKIRIVNFRYNDGKRFIPDELYDLTSSEGTALNSLFNLNNGGGKTVLVQLMLQPVHPKAMAGGRRIEDYFGRPGDHSFILIEWNKDRSEEKLLTGIAIAGSANASSEDNQRGNAVRYYTFLSEYERYSPYSISSLELSKNENGRYVPASFEYVREKAKQSKGALAHYSSDDSVKWVEKLSEYGILRSEWETVLETLNRDEGGLNQYFDDAKTSDKLIAKFFIPAIEQKMRSVASGGTDSSLETMLINYAKKISEKDEVIREKKVNDSLLQELSELNEMSDELYKVNFELTETIGEVCGFKAALGKRITAIEEKSSDIGEKIQGLEAELRHIDHEEKSKEYHEAVSLEETARADFDEATRSLEDAKSESDMKKHEEEILQSAKLYKGILDAENEISALKKLIDEKENASEDAEQIARLKYSVFVKAGNAASELEERKALKDTEIAEKERASEDCEAEMKRAGKAYEEAKDKYNSYRSRLEASRESSDERIRTLAIKAMRRFDGFYAEEELLREKQEKTEKENGLKATEERLKSELIELENRMTQIPQEMADVKLSVGEKRSQKATAVSEMSEYDSVYDSLLKVCEKYSLDSHVIFSGRLKAVVKEDLEMTRAEILKTDQDKAELFDRLKAAEEGHVHVFPAVMDYIVSTGISCRTGEEYLCGLLENGLITGEKVNEILLNYPEIAYSLLFDNEKELHRLVSAGNKEWLPAAVPLFTMEQMQELMDGSLSKSQFLAICDKSYFSDRDGYQDDIREQISDLDERLKMYKTHLSDCEASDQLAAEFDYPENWRVDKEKLIEDIQREIDRLSGKHRELEKEQTAAGKKLKAIKEELEGCRFGLQNLKSWFESFSELGVMLSKEKELSLKLDEAYNMRQDADNVYKKACDDLEALKNRLKTLSKERDGISGELSEIRAKCDKVTGAREADILDGELDSLYTQYMTLVKSLSDSLSELRNRLDDLHDGKASLESELDTYSCERSEYEAVRFSPERLREVKSQAAEASKKLEKCQSRFTDSRACLATATERAGRAFSSLDEFDGEVLPEKEIGEDFKNRRKSAKTDIKQYSEMSKALGDERRGLERIFDNAGNVLDELQSGSRIDDYQVGEGVRVVALAESPEEQWKGIREKLTRHRKEYLDRKDKLYKNIGDTVREFKDVALFEIVNKLGAIGELLSDAGIKGDRLFTVSESIGTMIYSIEKINRKIETDLREIENDFNDIVDQCMTQGKRIYNDLRTITQSSRAHIFEGKPQTQMVKMNLPEEKEISEEASRISIRTEIEQGANEIKELIKAEAQDKQIQKRARIIVGSERLLHKYIRQESIQVKVYKIDMNSANSLYKRWEDTLTQSSGAEKFVVFFAVVLTLMNYTRSSAGLVSRYNKSVLILDNPFGKITSAHLLKPMFDIAKHFNVQLICLSDINKSDVINCFECVVKLVIRQQNLSNYEIMTHEGNERIEHGYYKIMNGQMSLFQ